ncbi:MAG: alanine--tRNA ligase [Dehalococcoidia bacterium]|nr:MAG: alanine--tRNA ligase [Dehalococcoidia bacterium]
MTGDEIRRAFLEFFEERGHKTIPSSSLIPHGDPTLLLTSAGMVQIKPYFLGLEVPPNPRLASCQKCFRTTDIDLVGDNKHLTFFEMLGNFSVGDYFKKEAISWAWEFVTQRLELPEERLWVTIYLDDDEAFAYWQQVGVPSERILRFGEEDNFWGPAGDSGPCGPCSEIHYDSGDEFGCGRPECKPNCDCGRFSEIWNLVFTQYDQDRSGERTPLPKPNIDTGMGLERTVAATQHKASVYGTDIFVPLIEQVCHLSRKSYGEDENVDRATRIVSEHGRAATFLIADGVLPSNEGRGYILRRILRRASLFGRRLGLDKPFLAEIAEVVINRMSHVYPELMANRGLIKEVIKAEEAKFQQTLPVGMGILQGTCFQLRQELVDYFPKFQESFEEAVLLQNYTDLHHEVERAIEHFRSDCGAWLHVLSIGQRDAVREVLEPIERGLASLEKMVSGYDSSSAPGSFSALKRRLREGLKRLDDEVKSTVQDLTGFEVFVLKDTYGFPPELTAEIAKERGLSIDWEGFQEEMEKQREMARAATKTTALWKYGNMVVFTTMSTDVSFVGYETVAAQSKILELRAKGQPVGTASQADEVDIILDKTPFYGEMGGQVGDTGEISSLKGKVAIVNTVRSPSDVVLHQGRVIEGIISVGDEAEAKVDVARRLDIARNHTATHLLQAALREILGSHIYQKGSLVEPQRFRFDFSHLAAITEEQLGAIQKWVNERIRQNLAVKARDVPYSQAIAEGAIALFGEKYGETVRVVEIGEPAISRELCGGTHVKSTGEIGFFLISSESSIGTGLRRIEVSTGRFAESLIEGNRSALQNMAKEIGSLPEEVHNKVRRLANELEQERKRSLWLERELSARIAESLLGQAKQLNGVTVLAAEVPPLTMPILREMGDILRDRLKSAVVVLAAVYNNKPNFLAMVTPDLVARGFHAGEIVKQVAKVTGGGGGGKATMAQAGGKDLSKLDEALSLVESLIASTAKQSRET